MRGITLSKTSKYTLRGFEDSDENAIMQLFEKKFSNYGGYVPRTPEYWRWSCLERPDVEKEGIFVVVDQNETVAGYAVVGRSGTIWDFSYDPQMDILSMLLEASTRYLAEVGATSITLNSPSEDHVLNDLCKKLGFVAVPTPKMFLSIQNFRELILLLANSKKKELSKFNEVVLVKLKDSQFSMDNKLFLQITGAGIEVAENAQSYTIRLETDHISFSSMLFGVSSPTRLFLRSKLRVKPFWKTVTVLNLLSSLQMKTKWFFPLSDYG